MNLHIDLESEARINGKEDLDLCNHVHDSLWQDPST